MPHSSTLQQSGRLTVPGVRHRIITIREARLHLAEAGRDDAPGLLLLHGFPQHWFAWRHVLLALADRRHAMAVDLPGFGWSDPSRHGYSTSERSRTVVALLDELHLADADIIGHDRGGWLGFRVALDAPERVRRLVTISELHPWPLQRRLIPNLWRMWVTALFEVPGLGALLQRDRRIIRWFLTRDTGRPAGWTDELVDVYARRAACSTVARAGQRMHSAFVIRDIARLVTGRDRSRELAAPTLLVAGDRDSYIPASLLAAPRSRRGTLPVRTVPGGHFLLDENPDDVIGAIRSHLDL